LVERVVIFAAMIWDQLAVGWYAPLMNAHLLTIVKSAYIDMVNQYLVPNLRNVIEANEPRNVMTLWEILKLDFALEPTVCV
jgi:hypothetical protein